MTRTLFIATSNGGKLRDFASAAAAVSAEWTIVPLPGLAEIPAPVEDGDTFYANALQKALSYARYAPGCLVLADDSGLELDSLDGAPGVYSARYADLAGCAALPGESMDARNNRCLLEQLRARGISPPASARYRCSLVAVRDSRVLATADGVLEGMVLPAPRGTAGFGYDPLFLVPELGRTMAEFSEHEMELRLSLSHRGRALRALLPMLDTLLRRAETADSPLRSG